MRKSNFFVFLFCYFFSQLLSAEEPSARKIIFVDSYHQGYTASLRIVSGVKQVLAGHAINFKLVEMDTKRNPDPAYIASAAIKTKSIIEKFQPDVLIACDDNAAKYLIKPYYQDSNIPIIFCGINWDASVYGFPFPNMTGMIEVTLITEIIRHLKKYTKGQRMGFLGGDRLSERKNREHYQKRFKINFVQTYFANTFAQWKQQFAKLQNEVDMLIMTTHAGIMDWDDTVAQTFVEKHTKIPVATEHEWEMPYALVGVIKDYFEMGRWSGQAALMILDGIPPSKIPVTSNKNGRLLFNSRIAKRLGITETPELAEIVQ